MIPCSIARQAIKKNGLRRMGLMKKLCRPAGVQGMMCGSRRDPCTTPASPRVVLRSLTNSSALELTSVPFVPPSHRNQSPPQATLWSQSEGVWPSRSAWGRTCSNRLLETGRGLGLRFTPGSSCAQAQRQHRLSLGLGCFMNMGELARAEGDPLKAGFARD